MAGEMHMAGSHELLRKIVRNDEGLMFKLWCDGEWPIITMDGCFDSAPWIQLAIRKGNRFIRYLFIFILILSIGRFGYEVLVVDF